MKFKRILIGTLAMAATPGAVQWAEGASHATPSQARDAFHQAVQKAVDTQTEATR